MKIRTRLFILLVLFFGLGLYLLLQELLEGIRPHYLQSMEESMVDMSVLLAAHVENRVAGNTPPVDELRTAFDIAGRQQFTARIHEMTKTRINMRVYVTDEQGTVLFDSDGGRDEGKDYSQWNDVRRTLQGQYGARASRSDPDDPLTSLLVVAAPIRAGGRIIGVLSVCKPTTSVLLFLEQARRDILLLGLVAALGLFLITATTTFWVTRPIEKLTRYARDVRAGRRAAPPRLGRSEIGVLGAAFEEMRVALEGKQYVEEYVQSLTHQMKSPLSAIHGAAELLDEEMPREERRRFIRNIRLESARIRDLIDRMLQLSALENRRRLQDTESVDAAALVKETVQDMAPLFEAGRLRVIFHTPDGGNLLCEPFLVKQAIANLLQNAVDFSREDGEIEVTAEVRGDSLAIAIRDHGHGMPEYARDRIFERFYSLQRPGSGKKSSGLGLAFVREVVTLHGGSVTVENHPESGVLAIMTLPLQQE